MKRILFGILVFLLLAASFNVPASVAQDSPQTKNYLYGVFYRYNGNRIAMKVWKIQDGSITNNKSSYPLYFLRQINEDGKAVDANSDQGSDSMLDTLLNNYDHKYSAQELFNHLNKYNENNDGKIDSSNFYLRNLNNALTADSFDGYILTAIDAFCNNRYNPYNINNNTSSFTDAKRSIFIAKEFPNVQDFHDPNLRTILQADLMLFNTTSNIRTESSSKSQSKDKHLLSTLLNYLTYWQVYAALLGLLLLVLAWFFWKFSRKLQNFQFSDNNTRQLNKMITDQTNDLRNFMSYLENDVKEIKKLPGINDNLTPESIGNQSYAKGRSAHHDDTNINNTQTLGRNHAGSTYKQATLTKGDTENPTVVIGQQDDGFSETRDTVNIHDNAIESITANLTKQDKTLQQLQDTIKELQKRLDEVQKESKAALTDLTDKQRKSFQKQSKAQQDNLLELKKDLHERGAVPRAAYEALGTLFHQFLNGSPKLMEELKAQVVEAIPGKLRKLSAESAALLKRQIELAGGIHELVDSLGSEAAFAPRLQRMEQQAAGFQEMQKSGSWPSDYLQYLAGFNLQTREGSASVEQQLANHLAMFGVLAADPESWLKAQFESQMENLAVDILQLIYSDGVKSDKRERALRKLEELLQKAEIILINPRPNSEFIDKEHVVFGFSSSDGSGTPGRVSEVSLPGLKYNSGRIIKQALVELYQ